MPRVSVIIPTYNRANYIVSAIESVLQQTFEDFEIIVVDDGSTDNTRDVVSPYLPRICYIYQTNSERSVARNRGIHEARGEYIAFLDSDDVWNSTKIEKQVKVLDNYPDVALVYCQAYYIDENSLPTTVFGSAMNGLPAEGLVVKNMATDLLQGNLIYGGGSTPLTRRCMIDQAGLFDTEVVEHEDWDMWLRLARLGLFAYIPEPLASYRVYGQKKSLLSQSAKAAVQGKLRVIEKNIVELEKILRLSPQERASAYKNVYILAAMGNYQLKEYESAGEYLLKAFEYAPEIRVKNGLLWLIVDRAKIVERSTQSYQEASQFIRDVVSHLPAQLRSPAVSLNKCLGRLYVGGAFEQYQLRNSLTSLKLLRKGILLDPTALFNRGVISILARASLDCLKSRWGK